MKAWTMNVIETKVEDNALIRNHLLSCLDEEIRETLVHALNDMLDTISIAEMLEEIGDIAVMEDVISNKVGVDVNKPTVTWGKYENPNQVGVNADKSTVTWGMQLMLDREKLLNSRSLSR